MNRTKFVGFLWILDWDETAPKEIVDPNASVPAGWLENGEIDRISSFIYGFFYL